MNIGDVIQDKKYKSIYTIDKIETGNNFAGINKNWLIISTGRRVGWLSDEQIKESYKIFPKERGPRHIRYEEGLV